jgi:amino acid adenylation domain-containing protein
MAQTNDLVRDIEGPSSTRSPRWSPPAPAVWNDTAAPVPGGTAADLFAVQVRRAPDAVAVVAGDVSLSYGRLDARANQLAWRLRELGVGPDVLVGICLPRGVDMVVAVLAVLKAGGGYVPLDPSYPAERLRFMLADTAACVLVTDDGLAAEMPDHDAAVVQVDGDGDAIAACPTEPPPCDAGPDSLAYAIYTSGSTGTPKTVAIEHVGVTNHLVNKLQPLYELLDDVERQLQVGVIAPFTFDGFVEQLMGLFLGHTLVMLDEEERADAEALVRLMTKPDGLDVVDFTPSQLQQLGMAGLWETERLPRLLLLAGEPIPVGLWRDIAARPWVAINKYGPTECTVDTTACRVAGDETSIGAPLGNAKIYLVDERMAPVPVGVSGEILIGGVGLARGYLNRPGLTAERFVPDPFGGGGGRLYRTGDVGRWLADGSLEFVGRVDDQVKIRGFRVELGEVEAAVAAHPAVAEAAVVVRGEGVDRRLVAYAVPVAGGGELDVAGVRGWVKERLPEYMVPAAVVVLEALPLTPNGKVDRRGLPEPEWEALGAEEFVAPRTATEELVAQAFAEVLGLSRVGAGDDFFALGGHSLKATQLVSRLRNLFDIEIPLRDVFRASTVEAIAARVDAARAAGVVVEGPVLGEVVCEGSAPLSFAQQRLWFLEQLRTDHAVYTEADAFRLSGRLDVGVLEECLSRLERRHAVLRTRFVVEGADPVQVVDEVSGRRLVVVDVSGEGDVAGAVARVVGEQAALPFDLAGGPLWRTVLVRVSEVEHVLVVTAHHSVVDGWSVGVLWRELGELYRGLVAGGEPVLPVLPVEYVDFAVWQREWLSGPVLDVQLGYWRERLAGAPTLELPTDRPRPAAQSFAGDLASFRLPADVVEGLEGLARRQGVTLFMVLLGVFKVLLARYSGQGDVVVGTPIAGRNRAEIEPLVGFFINTLPLRTDLSDDPGFVGLLERVRDTTLGAYDHQDIPFEKLVAELVPDRDMSRPPLVQIMFQLVNAGMESLDLGDIEVHEWPIATTTTDWDMSVEVIHQPDGALEWEVAFNTDLFDRERIDRLGRHVEGLCRSVLADPQCRVSRLGLLDAGERAQVVEAFNDTTRPYPECALAELFEEQVRRAPDAVAVSYGSDAATYGELNRRANRLAHRLLARGAGDGRPVAVALDRSIDLAVALLGIVKAGASYVPLDLDYPAQRVEFMLTDSAAAAVVTRSDTAGRLPEGAATVLVDEDGDEPDHDPAVAVSPDHPVYVMYTSGSTGRPKGAVVRHRAVARLVLGTEYVSLSSEDRVAQGSNASFDAFTFEFWGALLNGGTLVGLSNDEMMDPAVLAHRLAELEITTLWITAGLFNQVTKEVPAAFRGVRQVLTGGEAADPQALERVLSSGGPPGLLINAYGPTETTTFATCYHIREVCPDAGSVPIGPPIQNTTLYVVDEWLSPAPVGVPGELLIGGPGVALGYVGRPGLTAERFVPDPFGGGGGRLYRTGDVARWMPDGTVEFLGRSDDQVKLRGFRVELGEVEAAMAAHPAVAEAVVVVRGEGVDRRLVAYAVPVAGGGELDVAGVRGWVKERLPEYMVPAAVVVLEALPLTPNGKVDRRGLPEPEWEALGAEEFVAPRTATEELVADVFAEVLGLSRVGAGDDFFALGGHSLKATQLVSRLRNLFDIEVPLRTMFGTPTVEAIARYLVGQETKAGLVEAMARARLRLSRMTQEQMAEELQQHKS